MRKQSQNLRVYTPVIYRLAAKTMSRLIAFEAVSIFLWSAELPMIEAAFLNSRHVSSSRTMVLTIKPSGTSVSSQISANGVPCPKEKKKKEESYSEGKEMGNGELFKKSVLQIAGRFFNTAKETETNLCPLIHHFDKAKLQVFLGVFLRIYW